MDLHWRQWLVAFAVALPFLNPFAPGPSPHVVPLLVGCACAALLLIAYDARCNPTVIRSWIAVSFAGAAMGLLQYFDLARPLAPWINLASAGEAYGNLRQRNQFATFMNIGVAAAYWWLTARWELGKDREPGWVTKHYCGLVLLVAANAATASRVGLLQLLLVSLFAVLWPSQWRARFAMVGAATLAAYALAASALPWVLTLVTGEVGRDIFTRLVQDEGCSGRGVLWSNALDLIRARPWTGWGLGNMDYAHYATLYPGERFCGILDNAHNLPLHLAAEFGLPVAFAACLCFAAWLAWRAPWRAQSPTHRLAWTVLAIVALHSLVEYPLWYAPFQITVGLCLLMLWPQPALADATGPKFRWLRSGAALLVFVFVAICARDYFRVSQLYMRPEDRSHAGGYFTTTELSRLAFFRDQAEFAQLSTTPLTLDNANAMAALAERLLPYSPEPRVIEMLIESLTLTGKQKEAVWHLARYRAAFPADYEAWKQKNQLGDSSVRPPRPTAQ